MQIIQNIIQSIIGISLLIMLFFSCKNDIKQIDELIQLDTLPGEFVEGLSMTISEKGKITALLTAPIMIREEHDSIQQTSFPDGFEMKFYDKKEQIKNSFKAEYGFDNQAKDLFIAKRNVIFKSQEENRSLYTEHLIWDKKNKMIYSYVPFKYVTESSTIYGDTLIADENMEFYTIKKSSADITVEQGKL